MELYLNWTCSHSRYNSKAQKATLHFYYNSLFESGKWIHTDDDGISILWNLNIKVKWSYYRPGVAQRVGRGIALSSMTAALEGDEWSAARPGRTLPPGKDLVLISQEAGWAPGPVWMGGKSRPHRDSIPDRPAHSQSLYRLSYPAHLKHQCASTKLKSITYQATVILNYLLLFLSVGFYLVFKS